MSNLVQCFNNYIKLIQDSISLGPHDAYFCMRTLKPEVAKASTVASVMSDK